MPDLTPALPRARGVIDDLAAALPGALMAGLAVVVRNAVLLIHVGANALGESRKVSEAIRPLGGKPPSPTGIDA